MMIITSVRPLLLILLSGILSFSLFAQQERPKIGLVLSGGGAKGIAHIGVIKALENAGITPDYVTGTSMGSIIGALYSIGYTADELEEIALTANWDILLSNQTPLYNVTFEEKLYYGRYLLEFFYENKKIIYPKGIIEGEALLDYFSYLTRGVHTINDFNDFPIPFACVATDIETGEPVVMRSGSLATAMRASMAIPSIFTPVKRNGKLLVDGGLVRNMPVDEVLNMGADIVIGVFVSNDLDPKENLNSAIAILSQSAFIKSAFDSRAQMEKCNILITPDLKDYSTGSFNSAAGILEKGIQAGDDYQNSFDSLADIQKAYGPFRVISKPDLPDKYIFDSIVVSGNIIVPDEYIIGKMRIEQNEEVSIDEIEDRLSLIYGTQYFEKIWYETIVEDNRTTLIIDVIERPRIQFRFAYHYDTENSGGIVANATFRNVVLNKSRLIFEANFATQPSYLFDYFKYLGDKQNIAFRASAHHSKNELPIYNEEGSVTNQFIHRYTVGGIHFQSTSFKNSTYGLGIEWTHTQLRPDIVNEGIRFLTKATYSNTRFKIFHSYNSLNTRYFPSSGIKAKANFTSTVGASGKFIIGDSLEIDEDNENVEIIQTSTINSLVLDFDPYIPVGLKTTIFLKNRIKFSNQDPDFLNLSEYDFVGGFNPVIENSYQYWGGGIKEFALSNYFYSQAGVQVEVLRKLFIQGIINYINTKYPMKTIFPDIKTSLAGDRSYRIGYGGLIGYMSPIGPISFSFAKDHYRKGIQTSLSIGFHY
ncbi:patatin-like phospholipase family protein [Marinigracilibium pacificum]|uniref:PNPLA domain-containing protein n=1 Tax=Marinigracilibium pacificum TaxID=2729599 RepID=A0A848IYK6_9BACT|nr:patatin-like phospholipase family protein [Marinigracilibium pacificum]NMM47380.1 hypothetical protein [Marinigracilibium pacificum]